MLEEDLATGQWTNSDVTMCGTDVCFNGLLSTYEQYILSFGEDQDGESICSLFWSIGFKILS